MQLGTLVLSSLAAFGLFSLSGSVLPAALAAAQGPQGGHKSHSVKSLKDAHGFTYSGSHKVLGGIASSGIMIFDGRGGVSADFTTSVGGTTFTGSFTGSYTVNPDGTGAIVIDLPWLNMKGHGNFVVVDDGNGTYFTSTDPGYSVTGSTRRI